MAEQLAVQGIANLPIDFPTLDRMSDLPLHHRDPFDRLLAAQAIVHRLALVTPNPAFEPYGPSLIW